MAGNIEASIEQADTPNTGESEHVDGEEPEAPTTSELDPEVTMEIPEPDASDELDPEVIMDIPETDEVATPIAVKMLRSEEGSSPPTDSFVLTRAERSGSLPVVSDETSVPARIPQPPVTPPRHTSVAAPAPVAPKRSPRRAVGPVLTVLALIVVVTFIAGLLGLLGYVARGAAAKDQLSFALLTLDGLRFWLPGLALALVGGALVLLVAGRRSSPGLSPATAWLFPFAAVLAGLLVLSVYHDRRWWFVVPAVTWLLLLVGTIARTFLREPSGAGHDIARTALTITTYVVAFLALAMLYINKLRSIYSATAVAVVCVLLLLQMTDGEAAPLSRRIVYAVVGGLILGQVTWVINYWSAAGWTGGAFLLAVFYLIAGLSAAQLRDRIGLFDVVEFGGVALLALAIVSAAVLYQS